MTGEQLMNRISICLLLIVFAGCSLEPTPKAMDPGSEAEVEDGGVVENADREKAQAFFIALGKVKSVEEEKKLLTEFGEWLEEKEYKIEVEVKDGKHNLLCPYFPPVTPWTSHSFLDIKNLELLPRLENGG